jgi:hypothetical protein
MFAVVLGVAVLETILSMTWNRLYFSVGIPIFREDRVLNQPSQAPPTSGRLEKLVAKSAFPPFAFRPIGENLFAFRERGWSGSWRLHYTPVVHGNLLLDPTSARLRVAGLANWFAIAFLAFGIIGSLSFREPVFLIFLIGLSVGIYAIQAKRFREVAAAAAEEWGKRQAVMR